MHMLGRLFKKKTRVLPLSEKSVTQAKAAVVTAAGPLTRTAKSPDEAYGNLFHDVQAARVYSDGKTFVDMVPRKRPRDLNRAYARERQKPAFDVGKFVDEHFQEMTTAQSAAAYAPSADTTAREHVRNLWDELKRSNRKNQGSLFALPYEYVVPGGRFSEQFYWDSYFIMLGLAADERWDLVDGMMKNYAYMIRKFGFIPTANRTYFLSRSQPPFFAQMVKLLAQHRGRVVTYAEYLPSMLAEYRFWMKGRRSLNDAIDNRAMARVVAMPNGTILNRYFDNKVTPRPESRVEDLETAQLSDSVNKEKIFLDLRAGAESGWDFSSRWFGSAHDIQSIHTTDIVAVDLNCLLYQLEQTIAEAYMLIKQPLLAGRFRRAAEKRAEAIRQYCWDHRENYFCDHDFRAGKPTGSSTLAGVFPLYAKIATSEQAAAVAQRIEADFLRDGGLVTTLEHNGQQWDAPNGWAPLQWVVIKGLREYGYHALANKIRDRWLKTNELVFEKERKMIEKYDVERPGELGGGGEYALQDGFGWTNGVYAALKDEADTRA